MRYQRQPPETAAVFLACRNRAEWLLARSKSLGTSDIGAILGISTFRKPLQVYAEKRVDPTTGKPLIPSSEPTEAMTWGVKLEDVVRRHYAEFTGRTIWHREHTLFRHPEMPFHASLDGIAIGGLEHNFSCPKCKHINSYYQPKGSKALGCAWCGNKIPHKNPKKHKRILEIKTAWGAKDWGEEGSDDIPLSYNAGVQWSMGILGPDWTLADVAVLFGGNKYRCYTVERDDAIIKQMQEEALTFWMRIENGQPPEVSDGSTATRKALEALYAPAEKGKILEADFAIRSAMEELEKAKAMFKEVEAVKKLLENQICAAIGPELGITDGEKTYKWKTQPRKGYTVEATTCRVLRRSENKKENGK